MTIPAVKPRIKPRGPFTPAVAPPLWPEPLTPDPMCVCGHRYSEHIAAAASVPLRANPMSPWRRYDEDLVDHLPADQRRCPCGCTTLTHDQCEYLMCVDDRPNAQRRLAERCRRDYGHDGQHQP